MCQISNFKITMHTPCTLKGGYTQLPSSLMRVSSVNLDQKLSSSTTTAQGAAATSSSADVVSFHGRPSDQWPRLGTVRDAADVSTAVADLRLK